MITIVPAIPAIFWIRALLSWVYLIIESMIAAPFWVVTHAMPEGNGMAGNAARKGYMLCVDIIIRPVLLTFGAILSIVIVQAWGVFLHKVLSVWMNATGGASTYTGFLDEFFYAIIILFIVYTSCCQSAP